MKKSTMVFAAIMFATLPIAAATETVNGITWTYTVTNGVASVGSSLSPAIPMSTSGSITIPSTLGGYPVTSIGDFAFGYCETLAHVTISDGVTSIGDYAFIGCSCLTSVTIPNSVTNIGLAAFESCENLVHVTMPNSMTSIGDHAFIGCSSLTSVTIPATVTSIGAGAFSGCSGLTSVTISNGVTNIGLEAFSGCSRLTNVVIPDSVTNIGNRAFGYCSGLTSVTIPQSGVDSFGVVFMDYDNLATVVISDSVTNIGNYVFVDYSLTSVTLGNSVAIIGEGAFSSCSGLTSVVIPDSVTSIGNYAFYGCSGLTHVIFKGNAPMVGSDAFYDVKSGCAAYVRQDSMGWGVDIPGRCNWNGLNITYLTPEAELAVANEAGSGTVEVDAGELVDVELASGVALMVMGENLDAAALAAKITPKPHEDGQAATLFKVKSESISGGVLLTAVLDEDAVDPETTVAEIVDRETVAAFGAAADGETVSVPLASAKSGLYYGIAVARDPSQLDAAAANVSLVRAGDAGATVPVAKPAGGAAFFKVVVSDRAR